MLEIHKRFSKDCPTALRARRKLQQSVSGGFSESSSGCLLSVLSSSGRSAERTGVARLGLVGQRSRA